MIPKQLSIAFGMNEVVWSRSRPGAYNSQSRCMVGLHVGLAAGLL